MVYRWRIRLRSVRFSATAHIEVRRLQDSQFQNAENGGRLDLLGRCAAPADDWNPLGAAAVI